MKTIGLLGGTGWSSTIGYYTLLNQYVNERLGGYHSAKILLKSIDYQEIMSGYGKDHEQTAKMLRYELEGLLSTKPDCYMICCNSLHKYYDLIKADLPMGPPVLHAVELSADALKASGHTSTLLLATQFTMEDGFFAGILEEKGIKVTIPDQKEREAISRAHEPLMDNKVPNEVSDLFKGLIEKYADTGAVVLGCTEFPLAVNPDDSLLPIFNPVEIQCKAAVEYALGAD